MQVFDYTRYRINASERQSPRGIILIRFSAIKKIAAAACAVAATKQKGFKTEVLKPFLGVLQSAIDEAKFAQVREPAT